MVKVSPTYNTQEAWNADYIPESSLADCLSMIHSAKQKSTWEENQFSQIERERAAKLLWSLVSTHKYSQVNLVRCSLTCELLLLT